MSLSSELTSIKNVEDTLTNNKVAQFAYTQSAYACNCADGVTEYDVTKEQNIPVGTPLVMNVNETVLAKGWRSQASTITRMLINHFLGRISYNLNKVNDNMSNLLTQLLAYLGQANGIATLDANGRIPYSQLPESAIEFEGMWNANTNTPYLHDGTGTKGDFYIVSVAGTQDLGSGSIQFFANDRVIYDGAVWNRLSAGDVKTVNNIQPVNGNITLTKSDIGLGNVANTADADKSVCYATSAGNATCFGGCTYACAKADFRDYTPSCATNATYACCASRDAEGCLFGTASRYSCTCFVGRDDSIAHADEACYATRANRQVVFRLCKGQAFCTEDLYFEGICGGMSIPSVIEFSLEECSGINVSGACCYGSLFIRTCAWGICGKGAINFDRFDYRVVGLQNTFCTDCGYLLYGSTQASPDASCCTVFMDGLAPTDWISGATGYYQNNYQFSAHGWSSTIGTLSSLTPTYSHCAELCHPVGIFFRCQARADYCPIVEIRLCERRES